MIFGWDFELKEVVSLKVEFLTSNYFIYFYFSFDALMFEQAWEQLFFLFG